MRAPGAMRRDGQQGAGPASDRQHCAPETETNTALRAEPGRTGRSVAQQVDPRRIRHRTDGTVPGPGHVNRIT